MTPAIGPAASLHLHSLLIRSTSPPEPVSKLLSVSYHSLTSSTWDADPTLASQDDFESDSAAIRSFQYYDQASQATALFPHPLAGMKKILEAGSFFFADRGSWDLSSRLEERLRRGGQGDAGVSLEETGEQAFDEDKRFVWNQYILEGLRDFRDKLEEEDRDELDDWGVIVRSLPLATHVDLSAEPPICDSHRFRSSKVSCRRQRSLFHTSKR